MKRKITRIPLLGLALLAALAALLVAGCNKVTGGGQFVSLGIGEVAYDVAGEFGLDPFQVDTTGDTVTFGLTAQPTGPPTEEGIGPAKGQLTLVDQTQGANIHADLQFTFDGSGPFAGYVGEGTARVNFRGLGTNKISNWNVLAFAADDPADDFPNYVEVMIWDPISGFAVAWSGFVQNGNIVVH